jgi:thioredoxin 1
MVVLYVLGSLVLAFVLFVLGLRVFMVMRIKRQQGKPAPELSGKLGRAARGRDRALFYFYSPSCGPCKPMTPVVRSMSGNVHAVDITKDMDTARRFGVMATPTTVLVEKGVVQRILVGPQPESTLRGLMARA